MLIEMIQEDIDNASGELSSLSCPVALAVKRVLPQGSYASVTADHIHIFRVDEKGCEKYKPSVKEREMVANFIDDFDRDMHVNPLPAFKIRKARKL